MLSKDRKISRLTFHSRVIEAWNLFISIARSFSEDELLEVVGESC